MPRQGAPVKRTEQRAARLLEALARGNSRRAASAAAGICHDTLERWMKADPDMAARVEAAEQQAQAAMEDIVMRAASADWKAAQWWLERRGWRDWGRKDRLELKLDAELDAEIEQRLAGMAGRGEG